MYFYLPAHTNGVGQGHFVGYVEVETTSNLCLDP